MLLCVCVCVCTRVHVCDFPPSLTKAQVELKWSLRRIPSAVDFPEPRGTELGSNFEPVLGISHSSCEKSHLRGSNKHLPNWCLREIHHTSLMQRENLTASLSNLTMLTKMLQKTRQTFAASKRQFSRPMAQI